MKFRGLERIYRRGVSEGSRELSMPGSFEFVWCELVEREAVRYEV